MPEVIGRPPSPRTALFWDGTRWGCAIVDAAGRIQVRGEDQLFSFHGVLAQAWNAAISGVDGYISSGAVPPNEVWVVTTITARDGTTAPTKIVIYNRHDGANVGLKGEVKAFAIDERLSWSGHTFLDQGDLIRAYFTGGLGGDTCSIEITGYTMTPEV